jgi:membrane-bound serine protease (ClpP class)
MNSFTKLLVILFCLLGSTAWAQKKIMLMDIKAEIDPRMTRYVDLALKHAEDIDAEIIVIEMDTYGGVLTDAKDIVDKILSVKVPVWVFINSDAASAGALISIACDSIYMAPGASIGAATVVDGNGERAPDKYQSYMRSIMRSTAEVNNRDPAIAEGMVDERVELDSIKKPGQVITLSTNEAIRYGYCEAKVGSFEDILARNNITSHDIDHFELGLTDRVVNFFLNPFISGLLILIILAGIYFEMQAPGLGFAGGAALIAVVLYLVPYYLNGLAENWEILALFAGFGLIGIELFVIPGFGVIGIAGITTVVCSLVLIMVNNDAFDLEFVSLNDLILAFASSLGGVLGGVVLLFVAGSRISDTRFYKRIALTDTHESKAGYTSNFNKEVMVGKRGVAQTVLRPSGRVVIDGNLYDAFTRGEYVNPGEPVEVILESGSSLQVKRIIE